jgi:hypothetical protein
LTPPIRIDEANRIIANVAIEVRSLTEFCIFKRVAR